MIVLTVENNSQLTTLTAKYQSSTMQNRYFCLYLNIYSYKKLANLSTARTWCTRSHCEFARELPRRFSRRLQHTRGQDKRWPSQNTRGTLLCNPRGCHRFSSPPFHCRNAEWRWSCFSFVELTAQMIGRWRVKELWCSLHESQWLALVYRKCRKNRIPLGCVLVDRRNRPSFLIAAVCWSTWDRE